MTTTTTIFKEESVNVKMDVAQAEELKPKNEKNNDSSSSGESCRFFSPRNDVDLHLTDDFVESLGNFSNLERYVTFWGLPRSGHSWIGSALDACPNTIVANEWDAWNVLSKGMQKLQSKDAKVLFRRDVGKGELSNGVLFAGLARNSFLCGLYGRIQVHDYTIPGFWQGQVKEGTNLQVIGDKKGGFTTKAMLSKGSKPWSEQDHAQNQKTFYDSFSKLIKVQLRNIIILRNPFDTVASNTIRKKANSTVQLSVKKHVLEENLHYIRELIWARDNLGNTNQWFVLKMEDFAMNTRQEFQRLCNFVGSDCTEKIINTVVQKTHHIPHLTRNDVKWDKRSVQVINNFIRENLGEFYNPLDMK